MDRKTSFDPRAGCHSVRHFGRESAKPVLQYAPPLATETNRFVPMLLGPLAEAGMTA